mmetsp:Transcript_38014/g.103723  ORF Transcript_38014/g.103723 Transcript_38014/m.103723 type:complete len:388 (+) Transcript_38014:128-1291(+)
MHPPCTPQLDVDRLLALDATSDVSRRALILYTSGTTGRPKGVVHTHNGINHAADDLITAWEWTADDKLLHFLPLHHMHGILNKLICPLRVGATVEFTEASAAKIWERMLASSDALPAPTTFMAVPTVYAKLNEYYDKMDPAEQAAASEACQELRLFVSGSAALPSSVMTRFKEISGHTLLERYGMTEVCMALSNPLNGERLEGHVGLPLPSVSARVVDEATGAVVADGETGELRLKGPGIFAEYFNNPEATEKEFDEDGWFKTGDIVQRSMDEEGSPYKICGRASVDIIKSGGYKISALDVEREILEHPSIGEVAVVGLEDDTWGEKVVAIVGLAEGAEELTLAELREFCGGMAAYKLPTVLKIMPDGIPRNAMGKVNKKSLKKELF